MDFISRLVREYLTNIHYGPMGFRKYGKNGWERHSLAGRDTPPRSDNFVTYIRSIYTESLNAEVHID